MFRGLFSGRYGIDNLGVALILIAVILVNNKYTWAVGLAALVYALFRAFSRNFGKRHQELQKFNMVFNKVRPHFMRGIMTLNKGIMLLQKNAYSYRSRYQQRKLYVFMKCTECKNMLRLPRNKGKLQVTCPVCKKEFHKKT